MKHLLLDSAPAAGETWESLLQRLADKTQQANTAAALIGALTAPVATSPEPSFHHKSRRLTNNSCTVNSIVAPESVDLPPTPSNTRFCKLQGRILQPCAIPSLQTSEQGAAGAVSGC